MSDTVRIASIGTSVPPCKISQSHALSLLNKHYNGMLTPRSQSVVQKLFTHPSIKTRSFSFNNIFEITAMKDEHPDDRVKRFTDWSTRLACEAILSALKPLPISTKDITCLIVNTCTGYICPGISTYILEKLNLNENTKVFDLVGSGCGGAIPNLQLGETMARQGEIVLCVSVEICSATFEMDNDLNLLVSNAIFGDGAAAVVLWNRPQGIQIIDSMSAFLPQYREDIRYIHKNGRLHNQLSVSLPKLIRDNVPGVVNTLLSKHNLAVNKVKHWAIHPGGEKILNHIQEGLGLSEKQMINSRTILKKHGNMSSPTVLFILKDILKKESIDNGDFGIATAFGAGLSIFTMLLHWDN